MKNARETPNRFSRQQFNRAPYTENLVDNTNNTLDDGKFTVGVFFDLPKAFHTVNHKILLKKLGKYGVTDGIALKWCN